MSRFLLDASVAVAWLLGDEDDAVAAMSRRRSSPWCPSSGIWRCATCWPSRNGARAWAPQGLRTASVGSASCRFGELPIRTDTEPNLGAALALARRHRLTICDPLYLELALRAHAPLTTVDRVLADAAVAEGRSLIGPHPELR